MLMMPVLLWPLPVLIYDNPMLADVLVPTWLLCSTYLLFSAVVMDSMLYGISSLKQAVDATLWVILFALLTIVAVQSPGGSWLLAMLFALHSFRSAYRLCWQQESQAWWLWTAWIRDVIAALTLLVWSILWPVY